MRAITFNQALLAVALLGLTLTTALGAGTVAMIVGARSGFADSGIGPSTTAAILLQAAAFAIPFIVLAAAGLQRQENRSNPLTFSQLLTVTGLLGLVVVGTQAPHVAVHVAEIVWRGNSPDYWPPLVLQVLAFMVPIAVIGAARLRALRVRQGEDEDDDAITFARLVRCLALFGLAIAVAMAPFVATTIVRVQEIEYGASLGVAANSFVALGAGVVVLVTVLALLFDRRDRLAGTPASPRLPMIAGLLGLGVVAAAYQSNTLLLVATLAVILGLFWLNAVRVGGEQQARSPLNSGWLLGTVALAGLAILATTTLGSVNRIASDLGAAASIAALVLLLAAYALNVTLLGLATRRLRGEGSEEDKGGGEGKPLTLVTYQEALTATGVLGLLSALALGTWSAFSIWSAADQVEPGPSVVVPVLLVVVSIAIPLLLTLRQAGAGFARSDERGISFTQLLTLTGLLGLVMVSILAPFTALQVSHWVWLDENPSMTGTLILQLVALLTPLGVIAGSRVRLYRAGRSPDAFEDALSRPRLLICLGLLALIMAVAGMPFAATLIASALSEGSSLASATQDLVALGAGASTLLAVLLLLRDRRNREEGQRASGLLVPAALLAFGAIAINYVFGAAWLGVPLIAFAILALCWLNSTGADPSERSASTAAWLRVGAPLTALVAIVFVTQVFLPALAFRPGASSSVTAMVMLALAYTIDLWILVRAMRRRRDEGQDETVAAAGGEPPQTPA